MLDAKNLLSQFVGDGGSFAKGAATGGLVGLMVGGKKTRKMAKNVAMYGGMAAVGALAYKAWQNHQSGQQAAPTAAPAQPAAVPQPVALPPPPQSSAFVPQSASDEQNLARALLRAMVAAAKADGHIDADEQRSIFERMDSLPLTSDDKAFVMDELRAPLDVNAVADAAQNQEQAAEIYAASLLAIDPDGPAERGYLGMLAARLRLDQGLVDHLHASVAEVAPMESRVSVVA